MVPDVFGSNKDKALAVVVFPHPLWPTKPKLSPKGISKVISSTAFTVAFLREKNPLETSLTGGKKSREVSRKSKN